MQRELRSSAESHGCLPHFCIGYNTSRVPEEVLHAIGKLTPGSEAKDKCPCCHARRQPGDESPFCCARSAFVSTAHVDLGLKGLFIFDPFWNRCCNEARRRGWEAYESQACSFCKSQGCKKGDTGSVSARDAHDMKTRKIYCFAHGRQSPSSDGFCCKRGEEGQRQRVGDGKKEERAEDAKKQGVGDEKKQEGVNSLPMESEQTLLSPRSSLVHGQEVVMHLGAVRASSTQGTSQREWFELKFLTLPGQPM